MVDPLAPERRTVDPADWTDAARAARAEGYTSLLSVGAVDELGRDDAIRVVCHLRCWDAEPARDVVLETRVPRGATQSEAGRLTSLTGVFAGAAWYEREVHEFFGVGFDGDPGWRLDEPLLNHSGRAQLRKDAPLGARVVTSWPGAKEPGESASAPSRRRTVPPGVPDPAVWGDRDPDADPADPGEIAASLAGGRARRRRP